MSSKTFANNIVRTQKMYGLNESDLAYVLNSSRRTLGRIKAATAGYTPTEDTIATIADAYGVDTQRVTKRLLVSEIAQVL